MNTTLISVKGDSVLLFISSVYMFYSFCHLMKIARNFSVVEQKGHATSLFFSFMFKKPSTSWAGLGGYLASN